jgi:hypothetical protein
VLTRDRSIEKKLPAMADSYAMRTFKKRLGKNAADAFFARANHDGLC